MKAIKFLLTLAVTSGLFIGNAVADTSFSTSSFYQEGIGNNYGPYGGVNYDTLTFTGLSGSAAAPSTTTIATYAFAAGPSCWYPCVLTPSGLTIGFAMTIGSETHDILFPWSVTIGSSDTLTVGDAAPVTFTVGSNYLTVTGLGFGPIVNGGAP